MLVWEEGMRRPEGIQGQRVGYFRGEYMQLVFLSACRV